MHRLLARQLKRLNVQPGDPLLESEAFSALLTLVSEAYSVSDEERARLERSLILSSTEMQEQTREIRTLAFTDKLTGLANRAAFYRLLRLAASKVRFQQIGVAVLFIDLDNFKLVNDSLGHNSGDELLQVVAARIQSCVGPNDTVARLGGDEFMVVLSEIERVEMATAVAQAILDCFAAPIILTRGEIYSTASIGVAATFETDSSADELIKCADIAMYFAKGKGKSSYALFDGGMQANVRDRLSLETCLRQALEKDEIFTVYQPIIQVSSGEVVGAEALVRWKHSTRGIVSPAEFVPIAEDVGVVVPIGFFVLERACEQMKRWQTEFNAPELTISVNVSGKQLQRSDFVERVRDILRRTKLSPESLKLEITESVLITNRDEIAKKLQRLKRSGVKFALDDFGTGYSSLSVLSAFPIDTLKIDRSFVSRVENDSEIQAIVRSIVTLARSMNMEITSEGIETKFQHRFVRELGCDTGQGYLFSKPLETAKFTEYLERHWGAQSALSRAA